MVRIRRTLPLQFLWQHAQFAEYVKDRCRCALRLAIAAIWERMVGGAFDVWRRFILLQRMRQRRHDLQIERAKAIIQARLRDWEEKHRVFHLGTALEAWKAHTEAMRLKEYTAAAIKVWKHVHVHA